MKKRFFIAMFVLISLSYFPIIVMAQPGSLNNYVNSSRSFLDLAYIGGSVSRAIFTKAVVNREPVNILTQLSATVRYIYFFTELKGMTGETVIHRWMYGGKVMKEVQFQVGGPRWRIWSSRPIPPKYTGDWTVSVVDAHGRLLNESQLSDVTRIP